MPASKKYLLPEAIAAIGSMEMRAQRIVSGFLSGMHRSPYFGQSVEFVQHREYVPGDDLRHIDWKVWGRQDRLYIKQYEEDTNLRCSILLDASTSMEYGRGPLNKFDYAATIAACLAYLCGRQQDAVGLSIFDDRLRIRLPWRSGRKQSQSIYESLTKTELSDRTSLKSVFRDVQQGFPKRGLVVLLTDFLDNSDKETLRGLASLHRAGHDCLVFHVMDDDELEFPFNDPTRFEGFEGAGDLSCNPRALREGYMASLQRFLDNIRRTCASYQADYHLVRTSHPVDATLTAFLAARMAHLRKR
jgi:uncharacterized protein (DUF58 family)